MLVPVRGTGSTRAQGHGTSASRVRGMLFRFAASTLAAFADSRLSATAGATLVLHTWTRKLDFHPHIHAIVSGGLSTDDARWNAAQRAFLFPVKAMSVVFRAKMLAALRRACRQGRFEGFADFEDSEGFARLARSIAKLPWHVYAKPSFARAQYILEYLGRYTHRVGLSNSRLVAVTDSAVGAAAGCGGCGRNGFGAAGWKAGIC